MKYYFNSNILCLSNECYLSLVLLVDLVFDVLFELNDLFT